MDLKESKEFLEKTKRQDKIAGAYIIYGGDKRQRNETALFLAKLLNCGKPVPCGKCDACKKIERRIYPDVKWIVPSKSILSIDDVRWVKEDIYITPYAGSRKIYIFEIEYMKDEASNAFLKILEEPPVYGVLVIQSSNINFFLPTIVSRCQKVRLNYAIPENGRETAEIQMQFMEMLRQARKRDFYGLFRSIDALVKNKEREEVEDWLGKVALLCRDGYFRKAGLPRELLVNKDSTEDVLFQDETMVADVMEKILELKGRVRYNINLKLGLDSLFLSIAMIQ